jgi:hypothetical protein
MMLMTGRNDAEASRSYEKAGFVWCAKEGLIAFLPGSWKFFIIQEAESITCPSCRFLRKKADVGSE